MTAADLLARCLPDLVPPERVPLSVWAQQHIRLPAGLAAAPGPLRLWKYQEGIADALGSPEYEKVSCIKSARIGWTVLCTSLILYVASAEPAPILCVLPVEAAARDFLVSDLEMTVEASPDLCGVLTADADDRSTLLHRFFPGNTGSLRIVAARSPVNLRRHVAKIVIADELDAFEVTREGDPLTLATRRAMSFSRQLGQHQRAVSG